jgi:hypothetical protein
VLPGACRARASWLGRGARSAATSSAIDWNLAPGCFAQAFCRNASTSGLASSFATDPVADAELLGEKDEAHAAAAQLLDQPAAPGHPLAGQRHADGVELGAHGLYER